MIDEKKIFNIQLSCKYGRKSTLRKKKHFRFVKCFFFGCHWLHSHLDFIQISESKYNTIVLQDVCVHSSIVFLSGVTTAKNTISLFPLESADLTVGAPRSPSKLRRPICQRWPWNTPSSPYVPSVFSPLPILPCTCIGAIFKPTPHVSAAVPLLSSQIDHRSTKHWTRWTETQRVRECNKKEDKRRREKTSNIEWWCTSR